EACAFGWQIGRHCPARHPCDAPLSILYLEGALGAKEVRRPLCQRQLLLQKRKLPQRRRKIFCRSKVQITSSFTSASPSRRCIFTRAHSVFSRSPTADRKPVCESAPATWCGRTRSRLF